MKQLTIFKKKFDEELLLYLDKKEQCVKRIDEKAGDMVEVVKIFLHYGGKRFRPALFYFAYKNFAGKDILNSLQFSYIFELFHTFALIHDDIIDHANLRRGYPTIHTKYGLHMGILSGDYALMLADELYLDLISQFNLTNTQITEANKLFNTYKQELLMGEYLDCIHIDNQEKIMKLKTADYSFVKPVLFALLFADKNDVVVKQWQSFLMRLGIVFQLKDDYEGVFSNEKLIGKSTTSDTEERKNTHITQLFIQRASQTELKRFHLFFGKQKISPANFAWYLNLLEQKNIKHDIIFHIQKECKELQLELEEKMLADTPFRTLINEIIIYINTF